MIRVELHGRSNEAGQLEVDLPAGLSSGEVKVVIELPTTDEELPWEERSWTDEELRELLPSGPAKTGAEIVDSLKELSGQWKQRDITDGLTWVEEQRRRRWEERWGREAP